MRYELSDLRLFLEIAQARSLTAGAAAVFITPSAASYRLTISYDSSRYYLYGGLKVEGIAG